jgi:hypothetical protein
VGVSELAAPPPYVDVEVAFLADLNLRAMVRSVAVEAAQADLPYAHQVRETTDLLVCALLQLAPVGARLRCLFRVLDGEVRVRASLRNPPEAAPEDKARAASLLDRVDVHVSTFTAADKDQGTELVYEAVVARTGGTKRGF